MTGAGTRAQANLLSLAVALVVLTSVSVGGVVVADGALADADADHRTRHAAEALARELVAPHSAVTLRANTLVESRAVNLTPADLDTLAPAVAGRSVRVRLGDRVLVERGDPRGHTVERVVVVGTSTSSQQVAGLDGSVTVPSRGPTLDVDLRPDSDTTVHTVRVDGRVVLHDPAGLAGNTSVPLPRDANATVVFETFGNTTGSAGLTTYPFESRATTLSVTVGSRSDLNGGDG